MKNYCREPLAVLHGARSIVHLAWYASVAARLAPCSSHDVFPVAPKLI